MNSYLILAFPLLLILLAGCVEESPNSNTENNTVNASALNITQDSCANDSCSVSSFDNVTAAKNSSANGSLDRVEVIHFHATHQCYSCITMGECAEETVNAYFAEELKSGRITFAHINFDLEENKELASKYGVSASSLMIGIYGKDGFSKEENINVWYKIGNKADCMDYLKGLLQKRLEGDLS